MVYIIEENIDRMGGVERIVSLLSNHISRIDNVTVISVFKNNNSFFEYNENVKKIYLSDANFSKIYSNKLKYLLISNKIRNICKKIKSEDTIIFGRVPVAIKFLFFIKNKPNIIVRDAINLYDYSKLIRFFMKKMFCKKINYFVISSKESLNIYKKFFGINAINFKIIYNPIGIDSNNKYNCNSKLIISNGRFDYQKGFEVLLNSFKKITKKYDDWKLMIVGDGPLKEKYQKYIEENNLKNKVILQKSSANIEKYLYKASIYVMTSRYEGYANSLVEALSLGIPSISFDCLTGIDEIIDDQKSGIIVKLKDKIDYYNGIDCIENQNNLADAISYLIENKNLRNNMSNNAKKILVSRNNKLIFKEWENMIYEKNYKNTKTTI